MAPEHGRVPAAKTVAAAPRQENRLAKLRRVGRVKVAAIGLGGGPAPGVAARNLGGDAERQRWPPGRVGEQSPAGGAAGGG